MAFLSTKSAPAGASEAFYATTDDITRAVTQSRAELDWLAFFLTADGMMAEACIVDACALATRQTYLAQEWLGDWLKRATVRSAIEMQQRRLTALSHAYEKRPCLHYSHEPLAPHVSEVLKQVSAFAKHRMDVLCRFAIVLRGVQGHDASEAASMLNISRRSLDAAYCAALESFALLNRDLVELVDEIVSPVADCAR